MTFDIKWQISESYSHETDAKEDKSTFTTKNVSNSDVHKLLSNIQTLQGIKFCRDIGFDNENKNSCKIYNIPDKSLTTQMDLYWSCCYSVSAKTYCSDWFLRSDAEAETNRLI